MYGCTREGIMQERGDRRRVLICRGQFGGYPSERKKKRMTREGGDEGEGRGKLTGIIAGQSRATHVVAAKCG